MLGLKLPSWLKRSNLTLPPWAKVKESPASSAGKVSVCIEADTDAAYREWLSALDVKETDQYWLEVVYQCAKLDLQTALLGTEYDPRTCQKPAEFHFSRAPQWAQKKFRRGRGPEAASQGREAREHYRRVRGQLPF